MMKKHKINMLALVALCPLLLFSSCTKAIIGKYIGDLDFNKRYTSYASLELKKDKTFVLRQETTTVETLNASSFVTETAGTYKMSFNTLQIESVKARDAEVSYRLDDLKTYRVLYSDSRTPIDTFNVTSLIIPLDTVYGEFQVFKEIKKTKFKKIKSNNSFYFVSKGVVFSKKIKAGNSLDMQTNCPNLYEVNKGPVNTY